MNDERRQQAEGLLGAHLAETGIVPRGPAPTDEELALFVERRLPESRRQEVLTHLAADPERYRQWMDLAAMQDEAPAAATLGEVLRTSLNRWLIDWRYAAGGLVAVAGTLLVAVYTGLLPPVQQVAVQEQAQSKTERAAPAQEKPSAPPAAQQEKAAPARPQTEAAGKAPAVIEEREAERAMADSAMAPEPLQRTDICTPLNGGRLCLRADRVKPAENCRSAGCGRPTPDRHRPR